MIVYDDDGLPMPVIGQIYLDDGTMHVTAMLDCDGNRTEDLQEANVFMGQMEGGPYAGKWVTWQADCGPVAPDAYTTIH